MFPIRFTRILEVNKFVFKIAICDDENALIVELKDLLSRYAADTGRDSTVGLFFLTSLSQYVWKGYEYGAINYLLKPMKYGRLKMELDRFFSRYQGREEGYLSFSNDNGKYKVLYKNLRYAETQKRNVLLHFDEQEQVIYKSMKEIASLLESQRQFARCHASFIVNMAYVKSVENLEAVLTTGERVPISQPKRKEFMAKLADFWGDML